MKGSFKIRFMLFPMLSLIMIGWGFHGAALAEQSSGKPPIVIKDMGSFHVGGRVAVISGKPTKEIVFSKGGVPAKFDPNGEYQVEQMYVQYYIPQEMKSKYPFLLWHGGGLSGKCYESTPDGREGWLNFFLRKGYATYLSDAVERGRSGWPHFPDIWESEPVFLPKSDPWTRFRIGPPGSYHPDSAKRKAYEGQQFPIQAYDEFCKQFIPRWLTSDDEIIKAYIEYIDRVGPSILLTHSQSGIFGFKVAMARPNLIKAIVAVEPAVTPPISPDLAKLKEIPILLVYGDYIDIDSRWPKMYSMMQDSMKWLNVQGGRVETIRLPEKGMKGNGHMMMMDKNSDEIALLIHQWLVSKAMVVN
jgi:pimeloyl-ACP methyl ester carboxylesterase